LTSDFAVFYAFGVNFHPVSWLSRRLLNHGSLLKICIARLFNQLYWYLGQRGKTWSDTYFLGVRVLKCPTDLWVYQEIIFDTQPDLIIETGTAYAGSALYLASLCESIGRGRVITVDINHAERHVPHERITYLTGSSTSTEILEQIKNVIQEQERVMVVLDSDHSRDHVLTEMRLLAPLVSQGCYLIVEDTCVNGYPILPEHGAGPMEAVKMFLQDTHDFVIDRSKEKFLLTFNPRGYLLRVNK
jgi:cephalosporin hydroxylase